MYVVVCYDISSNRRRARLHELLLGYGSPVQRSVFECEITSGQFEKLRSSARKHVRKGDSLRYYRLCARCRNLTQATGTSLAELSRGEDYAV